MDPSLFSEGGRRAIVNRSAVTPLHPGFYWHPVAHVATAPAPSSGSPFPPQMASLARTAPMELDPVPTRRAPSPPRTPLMPSMVSSASPRSTPSLPSVCLRSTIPAQLCLKRSLPQPSPRPQHSFPKYPRPRQPLQLHQPIKRSLPQPCPRPQHSCPKNPRPRQPLQPHQQQQHLATSNQALTASPMDSVHQFSSPLQLPYFDQGAPCFGQQLHGEAVGQRAWPQAEEEHSLPSFGVRTEAGAMAAAASASSSSTSPDLEDLIANINRWSLSYSTDSTVRETAVDSSWHPQVVDQNTRQYWGTGKTCKFCQKNGELPSFYTTHSLHERLSDGTLRVQCPILRDLSCSMCGATGDRAHTQSHCPDNQGALPVALLLKNTKRRCDGRLRTRTCSFQNTEG